MCRRQAAWDPPPPTPSPLAPQELTAPSIEVLPTGTLKLYKSLAAFEFNPSGMVAPGPNQAEPAYFKAGGLGWCRFLPFRMSHDQCRPGSGHV